MGFEWGWADIDWIAVVVAIVANMVVGMVWYNRRVLGTMWMEDTGMTEDKIREGNIPLVWGSMIVLLVITTIAIALVVGNIGGGLEEGLAVGAILGFAITAANLVPHMTFSQQPVRLVILNSLNSGISITLSGAIIGAFAE